MNQFNVDVRQMHGVVSRVGKIYISLSQDAVLRGFNDLYRLGARFYITKSRAIWRFELLVLCFVCAP